MVNATIRPARGADLAAIVAFDVHPGDRARELVEGHLIVAQAGEEVVGYAAYFPNGFVDRDILTYLCVHPRQRRSGVGVALIRAVEARIGAGRLYISTEDDNIPMLTLLPREGWTEAGRIRGIHSDGRQEVFFFKDLQPVG